MGMADALIEDLKALEGDTLFSLHGEPLLSDLECPLLQLSNHLYGVETSSLLKPISVVHACTESCTIITGPTEYELERETVGISRLVHRQFCLTLLSYTMFFFVQPIALYNNTMLVQYITLAVFSSTLHI